MHKIEIITEDNIQNVLKIEKDAEILKSINIEEMKKKIQNNESVFFCIKKENLGIVGFVIASKLDYINKTVWVQVYLYPEYRLKGIGTWANTFLLEKLQERGWYKCRVEIFKNNAISRHIYEKLQFSYDYETSETLILSKVLIPETTHKNAKVIVIYLGGNRRSEPFNCEDTFTMLRFLWEKERNLDNGCHMDLIFVNNVPVLEKVENDAIPDVIENVAIYQKALAYLRDLHGKKTRNGTVIVEERPNIGISYGAYDYVFEKYSKDYDFWFLNEDDYLTIKDGVMSAAIKKILDIKPIHRPRALIATVGHAFGDAIYGACVHGGAGVIGRHVLNQIKANNYNKFLNRGALIYKHQTTYRNSAGNEWSAEVPFSNCILNLPGNHNYTIELSDIKDMTLPWRKKSNIFGGSTNVMVDCTDSLINDFLKSEELKLTIPDINLPKINETNEIISKSFLKPIAEGLASTNNNKAYLEIGIRYGDNFNLLAPIFQKAYAIDTNSVCQTFISQNNNLIWHNNTVLSFVEKLRNQEIVEKFNMVFINTNDSYESISQAFFEINPYVEDNGLICFNYTCPTDETYATLDKCNHNYKIAWKIRQELKENFEIVTLPFHYGVSIIRKASKQAPWL